MTKDEWNAATDQYVEEENRKAGKPVETGFSIPSSWPQAHHLVTEEVIKDFAWNTGSNNPLYTDPSYAARTCWSGVIAPPGRFVHYIAETGSFSRGNAVDGHTHLYGGTCYDQYEVIRAGDRFTILDEYLGVEEKQLPPEKAAKYRLLSMRARRHYINQLGRTAVTASGTVLITCVYPGDVKKAAGDAVREAAVKPRYSEEELDSLYRYYEAYYAGRDIRGAEKRWWEDVQIGDPLTELIKGPVDIVDIIGFLCATGAQLGSSATKWEIMRYAPGFRDPSTNAWMPRVAFHYADEYARAMGFPLPLV